MPLITWVALKGDTATVGHLSVRRNRRVWELSRLCLCSAAQDFQRKINDHGKIFEICQTSAILFITFFHFHCDAILSFADFSHTHCFRYLLIVQDFQEILTFLQDMPTSGWGEDEVEPVLSQAYILSTLFEGSPSHLN